MPSKIPCYIRWRRLQIRVSVTVKVWLMPIKKSHVISDEGVYKLGWVLLFRYGLCLSIIFFKTLKNSCVISDEGTYKLGLVFLFTNCLYLPIYLQKISCHRWSNQLGCYCDIMEIFFHSLLPYCVHHLRFAHYFVLSVMPMYIAR